MAQPRHKLLLILISLLFAFSKPIIAQQQNQGLSISGSEQEKVGPIRLTVTDPYGRYVSGLNRDQITILNEKVPQEILDFEQQDEPFSLLLLFDVSKSMPANGLTAAREEFLQFVETGKKSSNYAIIGFGQEASMLTEFTRERDFLIAGLNKLATLKRSGGTAFYDAFSLAIEKIQAQKNKKRIILIISDGEDNNSESGRNDLREKLKRTDVLVYAIVFSGAKGIGPGGLPFAESDVTLSLYRLCSMTGGRAFYPRTSGEISILFDALALELKSQYALTFHPSSLVKDGEWRRLKYKVTPLEFKKNSTSRVEKVPLYIRGPEGYYLQ